GPSIDTFRDIHEQALDVPLNDDRTVVQWVKELPPAGDEPEFVMIFLMSTHQIAPLADADRRFSRGDPTQGPFLRVPASEMERAWLVNRYDDQLRVADARLRTIWNLLGSKGYLDDAVVIFSSDHGQMLGEHGEYSHGPYWHENALRIPMAVWMS